MIDNMSLEKMKTYHGISPVPDDFDAFWKERIKSLPKDYTYELIKRDFSLSFAHCYDLYFEGKNKSTIHSKCVFPDADGPFPVIFMFHGYQGRSSDWSECFKYVAAGYGVVFIDVRDQAGESIDNSIYKGNTVKGHIIRGLLDEPENLFYVNVYLDTYQLIDIVSSFNCVETNHLYTFGASQGGALAIVAGALNTKISSIVSIYPFLSDFKRVLELGDHSEAYNELF